MLLAKYVTMSYNFASHKVMSGFIKKKFKWGPEMGHKFKAVS